MIGEDSGEQRTVEMASGRVDGEVVEGHIKGA